MTCHREHFLCPFLTRCRHRQEGRPKQSDWYKKLAAPPLYSFGNPIGDGCRIIALPRVQKASNRKRHADIRKSTGFIFTPSNQKSFLAPRNLVKVRPKTRSIMNKNRCLPIRFLIKNHFFLPTCVGKTDTSGQVCATRRGPDVYC